MRIAAAPELTELEGANFLLYNEQKESCDNSSVDALLLMA